MPPLRLIVHYLPPNPTNKRWHWTRKRKEKIRAFLALSSALHAAAHDSSMRTDLQLVAKTCLMHLNTHVLFATIVQGSSGVAFPKGSSKKANGNTP